MAQSTRSDNAAGPVDDAVGAREDVEFTAQQIGSAEIRSVAISDAPIEERRKQLRAMRTELEARRQAGNADLGPLVEEIDGVLGELT